MLAPFLNEIVGKVGAACPELVPPGTARAGGGYLAPTILTTAEMARENLVEKIKRGLSGGQGEPSPPYAIVQIGALYDDATFGADNDTKRARLAVYYLDRRRAGFEGQLQAFAKAEAIRKAIDFGPRTSYHRIELGSVDASEDDPAFDVLVGQARSDLAIAVVRWEPGLLIGETLVPD